MNRREFLLSAGAATLFSGCRSISGFGSPNLRFGVVSDIHVTTAASAELFEKSLRYFKRRGVDAVMVPGDLTDWGLKSSLRYVHDAWSRVFGGTAVVPLFCTGNHDYDGWRYGDMTMEMHANGYSEDDRIFRDDASMAAAWEQIFGEAFAPIRLRTVKGYHFVSGEYHGADALADFMKGKGGLLRGEKPFFYFQHLPIKGTTSDSFGWADGGKVGPVLREFPNCIAFTGHTHVPFIDERSIWQGDYAIVCVPSLSYACLPGGYDNGDVSRAKGEAVPVMQKLPYRRDLRGGQGYVVSVWDDRVVIERRDLEEDASDAPAWEIPWPPVERPYDYRLRAQRESVPAFPVGAKVTLSTRNDINRLGDWAIVLDCRFPSARVPKGSRVFDYEIRVVPRDGSKALVRRFAVTSFARLAKYEPESQRFWFDVRDLPQDRDYVVEVRARNSFGKASEPIVSDVWHGRPGLDKVSE